MGAKASKIEGEYLPDTPTLNKLRLGSGKAEHLEMTTPNKKNENELLDPRSPNGCRTPLNFLQPEQPAQTLRAAADQPPTENAFSQLRKRLLKGFSLNDPRSPQLNRTPLILDEVRSLNMDDTFADLFVDTRAPARPTTVEMPSMDMDSSPYQSLSAGDVSCDSFGTPPQAPPHHHNNSSLEIVSLPYDEEETMPCTAELPGTPAGHHHYDPRSPSIGVERTPILFCDDDEEQEARETEMLEQILETLTLNLSAESSMMASFASAGTDTNLEEQEPCQAAGSTERQPPANKHLDRVRLGNKRRVAPRKPARASKTKIYMDKESSSSSSSSPTGASTPKTTTPHATPKRTPLSCVKNRAHLRSRSTERGELRKSQLLMSGTDGGQIGAIY